MDKRAELRGWLDEIAPHAVGPSGLFLWSGQEWPLEDERGAVVFCTATHTYHLTFTPNYLGGAVSSRTVRAGEDWTRGNDLTDGEFSRETFDRIIQAVLAYELVDLVPEGRCLAEKK